MKKHLLVFLILSLGSSVINLSKAQVIQDYFFKNLDLSYINPAALTMEGGLRGNVQYNRNDMDKVNTEVGTQFQLHSNFKNHGVGISLQSHKSGIFSGNGLTAGYGYRVRLTDNQSLSVGTRATYYKQSINRGQVQNANVSDPVLYGDSYNEGDLMLHAGVLYEWKGLQVGITSPEFLPMESNTVISKNFNAYLGYTIPLEGFDLRPNFYYEDVKYLGNWYEIGLYGLIEKQLSLEGSYTSEQSVRMRAGFNLKNINLAYGFDSGNSTRNGVSKTSHQIFLEYRFGKVK